MTATDDARCRALTADGERCTRPADDDGFCYQHDESDPTVDEREDEDERDAGGADAKTAATDGSADGERDATSSIAAVREAVLDVGGELIGHELERVVAVERDGDDWRATVEVVERPAVPDTQDILGRYTIDLDGSGSVSGYRRLDRYRRADTTSDTASR